METDEKVVAKQFLSNSNEKEVKNTENGEQEEAEEEEALSLCDLDPIDEETIESRKGTPQENKSIQDEFDFCSFSNESEMCSADELFFQGQILPLPNSVTWETGFLSSRSNSTTSIKYLSRSESMDNSYSSSRSSSLRSHQSSTSSGSTTRFGGGSSVTTPIYKPRVRNDFSSHPSPKPHVKFPRTKNQNVPSCNQKSTMWSLFRLGLVATPEIVLEDLKHRSCNKTFQKSKSFGSHSVNKPDHCTRFKSEKKKQGIFEVNGTLFSTCTCSSNVVDPISSRNGSVKIIVNAKDTATHAERKGTKQQQEGKQAISRHRTFEWLKQLSLDRISSV